MNDIIQFHLCLINKKNLNESTLCTNFLKIRVCITTSCYMKDFNVVIFLMAAKNEVT